MAVWVSWEEEEPVAAPPVRDEAALARVVRHVHAVMDRVLQGAAVSAPASK